MMIYFFDNKNDIVLAPGMQPDQNLKPNYRKEVDYQNHTYSLYEVYSRKLTGQDKVLLFLKCLGKTLLSFGTLLIDKNFRDDWLSVFTDKHVRAIYLPVENSISSPTTVSSSDPNLAPILDPHSSPIKGPLSATISLQDSLANELFQILNRLSTREGLNLDLLNLEEKKVFRVLTQIWNNREEKTKINWTTEELALLFDVAKRDIDQLFFHLQFFHTPLLPLNSDALEELFKSITSTLDNTFRANMHWAVKMLWNPHIIVPGKENRFPKGIDRAIWKIEDLSMFLAVERQALIEFLNAHNVVCNENEEYLATDIDQALEKAPNSEINDLLESHRIQKHSLRFATA